MGNLRSVRRGTLSVACTCTLGPCLRYVAGKNPGQRYQRIRARGVIICSAVENEIRLNFGAVLLSSTLQRAQQVLLAQCLRYDDTRVLDCVWSMRRPAKPKVLHQVSLSDLRYAGPF